MAFVRRALGIAVGDSGKTRDVWVTDESTKGDRCLYQTDMPEAKSDYCKVDRRWTG